MTIVMRESSYLTATPKFWPRGVESIIDYNNSAIVMNELRRADRIVITSIGGLSGPDISPTSEKNPDSDGELPLEATYGGRTITLRGYVESGNLDKMRALYSYLLDGFDEPVEAPLWFRYMDWRDQFIDSLALVDYSYDAGTGTLTIATDGTGLQPTSTANKQIRVLPTKSDGTSPSRFGYGDGEAIVKFRAGTSLTGLAVGPEFRRTSSIVKLRVIYEKATNTLRLYKVNTATTQLATVASTTLVVGTDYWIRVRAEGTLITFSLWTTYPPDTGTTGQLASQTHTLAGGDVALYPSSDTGLSWGLYWTPNSITDRVSLLDAAAINPGDAIINCRKVSQIESDEVQTDFQWRRDFLLTLRSSDSRMVARKPTKVTLTPPGTPVLQTYYSASISNLGRSPADMLVRFNGQYFNPSIYLAANGKILGLEEANVGPSFDGTHGNSAMTYREYVELNTSPQVRTVIAPGIPSSVYEVLSSETTWPQLLRGSNELRIVTDKFDDFYNTVPPAVLNGRVAAPSALGTWATSGSATDFVASAATSWGDSINSETRSTTSDTALSGGRYALVGTTNYTDGKFTLLFRFTVLPGTTAGVRMGLLLRYVNSTNHLVVSLTRDVSGFYINAKKVVVGVESTVRLQPIPITPTINTWYELSVTIRSTGKISLELFDPITNAVIVSDTASYGNIDTSTTWPIDADLATGGAIATGKIGIHDFNPSVNAITRYYGRIKATTAIDSGTIDITYRHSSR